MISNKYGDNDITTGIVGHDPIIYQYLDRLYYRKVIQFVRQNSGTTEEGEEHYQDVIFEIYLIIDQGRYDNASTRTFAQYFWIVTKNRWIDKLRKRKSFFTTELNETTTQQVNHTEYDESSEALYTRLIMLTNKYLRQMTDEEQEYIRLYYYACKSLQFIADHFGITYDYARLKLHRIRTKLRNLVKEDPDYVSLPNLISI